MATRREVLGAAALVSMLPMIIGSHAIEDALAPLQRRFYKIIFDRRYPASAAFGDEADRLGASTQGFDGDITDVWYGDLHPQWTAHPAAVAGLTNHRALICLESFARDHRLRVIYQGEHRMRDDGSVEHLIRGPRKVVEAAIQIPANSLPWTRQLTRILRMSPPGVTKMTSATFTSNSEPAVAAESGTLFSWIIAGVNRA